VDSIDLYYQHRCAAAGHPDSQINPANMSHSELTLTHR
jgi:hypothetical protein